MRYLGAILAGAVLLTGAADAKPPLRDVAEIDGALFDLGVADRIRKNCPTISARMLRAISYVHDLEQRARALGYTSEEIDAYMRGWATSSHLVSAQLFAALRTLFGLSYFERLDVQQAISMPSPCAV